MNSKTQFEALSILRPFIKEELMDVGDAWWPKLVLPYLHPRNQERAWRMGDRYLSLLDLSDAIRVLKGNWDLIEERHQLDPRYFGLLGHLRCARNASAHASQLRSKHWEQYDRTAVKLFHSMVKKISRQQVNPGLATPVRV